MMNKKNNSAIYEFAIRLRHIADKDYLSARVLFKNNLYQQAYWYSLQAIEKYLKTILLYNQISFTKAHDLSQLVKRVKSIKYIEFQLSDELTEFINHLNQEGAKRYWENPSDYEMKSLLKLDELVWSIRKFCFGTPEEVMLMGGGLNYWPLNINRNKEICYTNHSHPYQLLNGLLEKVLNDKKSPVRVSLVWNNLFYGEKTKRVRLKRMSRLVVKASTYFESMDEEIISEYIHLTNDVLAYNRKEKI